MFICLQRPSRSINYIDPDKVSRLEIFVEHDKYAAKIYWADELHWLCWHEFDTQEEALEFFRPLIYTKQGLNIE